MTSNRLKMNSDKTDCIWLGSKQQLAKIQYLAPVHLSEWVSTEVTCLTPG